MGLISDAAARSGDGSKATSSTSSMTANERKGVRKEKRMNLLSTSSFKETFNAKRSRKRPKVAATSLASLLARANSTQTKYEEDQLKGECVTISVQSISVQSISVQSISVQSIYVQQCSIINHLSDPLTLTLTLYTYTLLHLYTLHLYTSTPIHSTPIHCTPIQQPFFW